MLLAIDTSTAQGGVALAKKNGAATVIVRDTLIDDGWQHGRLLISAVEEILKAADCELADITAFACGIGPGSYTGTRIGVVAAKTFAWSLNKPLYGVSSLAALARSYHAANVSRPPAKVIVMEDARRDEIYTGVYAFTAAGELKALREDAALSPAAAAALVDTGSVVTGRAWEKYPAVFAPLKTRGIVFQEFAGIPTLAASAALLAIDGGIAPVDPKILEPLYLRREEAPCSFEKFMNN